MSTLASKYLVNWYFIHGPGRCARQCLAFDLIPQSILGTIKIPFSHFDWLAFATKKVVVIGFDWLAVF
jgi:hypothetical protein